MPHPRRTPFFLTAPSRSGSSLLTFLINRDPRVLTINEPVIGLTVDRIAEIQAVFHSVQYEIESGSVLQRFEGNREPTDTYPNSKLSNGRVAVDPGSVRALGIKVSYPAYSDAVAMDAFTSSWSAFIDWMTERQNGRVIVLVRNPVYTILSWKTTFEPLRGTTEAQCEGWNRICRTILSETDRVLLVRYEDVVADPIGQVSRVLSYLGQPGFAGTGMPPISAKNDIAYYRAFRQLDIAADGFLGTLKAKCGECARELGYAL